MSETGPIKKRALSNAMSSAEKKKKKAGEQVVTHIMAVDIEKMGNNIADSWMPEFALAVFRVGETEPAKLVRAGSETGEVVPATFYAGIEQPSGKREDEITAVEFWDNPAKGPSADQTLRQALNLRLGGGAAMSEMEAMRRFVLWARTVDAAVHAAGGAIMIISDTAAGDFPMLDTALGRFAQSERDAPQCLLYLFGSYRTVRDISAFYFGLGRRLQFQHSEEVALDALGLDTFPPEVTKYAHDHNPLNDALEIGAKASFVIHRMRAKQ